MTSVTIAFIVLGLLLAGGGVYFFFQGAKAKKDAEAAQALAQIESKKALETAQLQLKRAEAEAQKAELDAKERVLKARESAEAEIGRRRTELNDIEKRILQKE